MAMNNDNILEVRDLQISFGTYAGEVQAVRGSVDLDRAAGTARRRQHLFHVGVDALAGQEKAAGRVSEHRDARVFDRPDEASRLLVPRQSEARMHRSDDHVEKAEVGEILLWIRDGLWIGLEQAWFTDEPPASWPDPAQVRLS